MKLSVDLAIVAALTLAVAIFFSIRYEPLLGAMMIAGLIWAAIDRSARAGADEAKPEQ